MRIRNAARLYVSSVLTSSIPIFPTTLFSAREVLGSKGEASFPDLENTEWKNGMKPLPELGMGF
jgi:hypothetical protein